MQKSSLGEFFSFNTVSICGAKTKHSIRVNNVISFNARSVGKSDSIELFKVQWFVKECNCKILMATSSAIFIDELYTEYKKGKKQTKKKPQPTPSPQNDQIAVLLARIKELEAVNVISAQKLIQYIQQSQEDNEKIEALTKKQIEASDKEIASLKASLNAEQKKNLELTQKLADAKSTVNKSVKENAVDDARIEELMAELEITTEELQDAQEANKVAYDSIQQFEDAFAELTRQMQSTPEGIKGINKQLNAMSAVLKSDAIFQSKRQKSASLFGQYFTDLLKYAKAFGEGKLKSGVEAVRDANNKIFPRIVKTANNISNYLPDKTYGTALVLIAELYRDYLRAYFELKSKSKSIIEANAIQKIVDEDNFPVNKTVSEAFIAKYQNNQQQAGEVVKLLRDIWLRASVIIETLKINAKEKDLDVEATIAIPLVRLMSDIVFYGAAQLSGEANDFKAATKMKEGIISESKTFGLDLYVGLTDSKDRSLVEKFNPFKEQKSSTSTASSIKTTTEVGKPTNSKLKFRVVKF